MHLCAFVGLLTIYVFIKFILKLFPYKTIVLILTFIPSSSSSSKHAIDNIFYGVEPPNC